MNGLHWYLILAAIWILLTSQFTLLGLLVGFALSMLVLGLTGKLASPPARPSLLKELLALILSFLFSVLRANATLAWDILWHRKRFSHAFFKVDCSALSPWQTVLLGNLISLTPGSLTLDADEEGRTLYVHTLYGDRLGLMQGEIHDLIQRMSRLGSKISQEKRT
jgi:multicomponent Na+:H+ antiporter subunit E